MANKKPCDCPKCKGALRDPKTVKQHAKQMAAMRAAHEARAEGFARAELGAYFDSEEDEREDDGSEGDQGDNSALDEVIESGIPRPNKRRRIHERTAASSSPDQTSRMGENDENPDTDITEPNEHFYEDHNSPDSADPTTQARALHVRRVQRIVHEDSQSEEEPQLTLDSEEEEEDLRARAERLNMLNDVDEEIQPDEDEPDEEYIPSRIDNVKTAQAFIKEIRKASLDNDKLDKTVIEALRAPEEELIDIGDPDIRFSLDLYLSCTNASEATYNNVRKAIIRRFPETEILSYYLAKKLVSNISGVVSVQDDMCIKSCHAFTGPFSDLDACAICSEPRYTEIRSGRRQKRVPRQQATTIPLGPQIQALRRSVTNANSIKYQDQKIQEIVSTLSDNPEEELNRIYDDILCGDNVLQLSEDLKLTSDDTMVIFSLDGAQLYQNKKSDTWIGIWIVVNYDPKTRYRKKHVLPAFVVPGPNKPKNIDSYLFRSFYHLSAIQRENGGAGIRLFDAAKEEVVFSRTILLAATADALGLTELDGRVGHHGAHGCRKGCPMKGRHKPSSGHYFAAHLKPNNYSVPECSHADFDFHNFPFQLSPEEYEMKLSLVVNSADQADYERNRRSTGISKPSILSGLHPSYMLPIPLCFTIDLMHLFGLNIPDLLVPMWRGTHKCEATDNKATWDWVTLTGDTWTEHGKLVADATKYFPSSFHRPPRNPAEKISSGYKSTEYYLYLFGLGPAVFRVVLPDKYWKNFCKLVRAVHIVMQRRITGGQPRDAHSHFVQFVEEFEHLYYQRRPDRLHFGRPCLHTCLHVAPEIFRLGNGCHTDQYTMERAIGDLGKAIRQPSNPFGNLAQVALRQAQINAMKSICPELDEDHYHHLPRYSRDLGKGFALLRPREKTARSFSDLEIEAIQLVCRKDKRQKWGRLQLPNGQVARSKFLECKRNSENTRISRNVKVNHQGNITYGEVQLFFLNLDDDEPGEQLAYALLSVYGPPNQSLLEDSSQTLHACKYTGDTNLCCVRVTDIVTVVSMQPLPRRPEEQQFEDLWFVVEKSGLDDVQLSGYEEAD